MSRRPSILFLNLEFRTWRDASHWGYSNGQGLELGLQANNVDYLTIPVMHGLEPKSSESWLSRAKEIVGAKRFDQVWLEIVHSTYDEDFLGWISGLAPVRVGFIPENVIVTPAERAMNAEGAIRREKNFNSVKPYITHFMVPGENELDEFNQKMGLKAKWWGLPTVSEQFLSDDIPEVRNDFAVFYGFQYERRKWWLEHPELQGLLVRPEASPEHYTEWPNLYDDLQSKAQSLLTSGVPIGADTLNAYLEMHRQIRRHCFMLWLEGLKLGCAVVNLPQPATFYPSRVFEGIAAGRPVIMVRIADCPRANSAFEDGREILFYSPDSPAELAEHIRHIQREPEFGRQIAQAAVRRVRSAYTTEILVREILQWTT